MLADIDHGASTILDRLESKGYQAYLVGGCVRDMIRGCQPHDWDICTSATPDEIRECFSDLKFVNNNGIKHGTVTVMLNGSAYEVTTFRIDGEYTDGRRPNNVVFTARVEDDLARRDFTINAIACTSDMRIIDPFFGESDIKNGIIRCVGDPRVRFKEDGLRILRAMRFASTMGFDIAPSTSAILHKEYSVLENISNERICAELSKLLVGVGAYKVIAEYVDVISYLIPEISRSIGFQQNNQWHRYDVWEHTLSALQHTKPDLVLRLSILFHDIGKPRRYQDDEYGVRHFVSHEEYSAAIAYNVLSRLRFDNKTINSVVPIIKHHDIEITPTNKRIKRLLNRYGEDMVYRLIDVQIADKTAQNRSSDDLYIKQLREAKQMVDDVINTKQCFSIKDLAVNGNDVMSYGVPKGKMVGQVLSYILNAVLDGQVPNDKDEIKKFVFSTCVEIWR